MENNEHKTNWLSVLKDHLTDLKGAGWTDENLTTIDGLIDDILLDTGTTIPGTITAMQGNVTDILADTGEIQVSLADGGFTDLLIDAILADVGDASGATLGSILGILGDPAQSFLAMIGYEGATSLANKLTAARAGYLDELDFDLQGTLATLAGYIDAEVAAILLDTGTTIPDTITTLQGNVTDILADTGEIQVSLADGGFTDLLIDAIKGVVDDILADTSVLTLAAIEGEAVDALESFDLDHLVNTALGAALDTFVIDDSILGFILAKADVSNFDRTTDSLEAIGEAIAGIAGVNTYMEQIPDTDFALAAIDVALTADPPGADAENSVVDIDVNAGDTFVLRSLWVNVTNFGTGTKLTFKLWVLVNTAVTMVDEVDISALGIQNLMDIFGLQEVHADGIWITVQCDVGNTGACSGTWKYAKAT